MKKVLLIVSIVFVTLASLPLIGNKIVESELSSRLENISSYGVEIKKENIYSKYLVTKKHYEFVVSDADKFIGYLSKHSNAQIPPFVNSLLDGTTMGVDLVYNNIPISKAVSVDIYPISLSKKAMEKIKEEDNGFASHLNTFLRKGGFKYHLNYNVLSKEFDGYIKDIDESYDFASGEKLGIKLEGSTFSGRGLLVAPEVINSDTKKIYLDVTNKTNRIIFDLNNTHLSSVFESRTTYRTDAKAEFFSLNIDDIKTGKTKLNIVNPKLSFASDTKGLKAKLSSKSSFDNLALNTKMQEADISGFSYDVVLDGIDKDAYEELSHLLDSVKYRSDYQASLKLQKEFQKLFVRGFELNISDFFIKNMKINKRRDLKGVSLTAAIKLPQNNITKINVFSSLELLNELDFNMHLNISKPMFVAITQSSPIVALSKAYAKEKGDYLVYDIKMHNGSVSVNNKRVR